MALLLLLVKDKCGSYILLAEGCKSGRSLGHTVAHGLVVFFYDMRVYNALLHALGSVTYSFE